MYCWKCGSQIREGSAFCPMCGVMQNAQEEPKINLEFGFDDGSGTQETGRQETGRQETGRQQTQPTEESETARPASGENAYEQAARAREERARARGERQDTASRRESAGYQENAYQQAQRTRKTGSGSGLDRERILQYVEMGGGLAGLIFLAPFVLHLLRRILFSVARSIAIHAYRRTTYSVARFLWNISNILGWITMLVVILLLIAAIAVLAGLIYMLVTRQGYEILPVILAIVVTGLLIVDSIVYLAAVRRYPGPAGWVLLLLVVAGAVIGIDLFVKVFLEKRGLTGSLDLGGDIALLKERFHKETEEPVSQERYTDPNIPQYEATPEIESGESYFDGKGVELFGMEILLGLLTAITCSLATPWALVRKLKWVTAHTVIEGKRQHFNGTATELFGHWIKWLLLSLITCGFYLYYAHIDYMKWVTKHTTYVGREMPAGNEYRDSFFDGSFAEYIGTGILSGILTSVTCGIGTPWAVTMRKKFDVKSQVVCGERYFYDGTGGSLFGVWIGHALLTLITCGIYSSWAQCAMLRYYVCHTHVDATWQPARQPMRR